MHSGEQQGSSGAGFGIAPPGGTVGICSWQRGFCHGTFNAGLVHLAAHAFPGYKIQFHAETSHIPFLRDALSLTRPGLPDALEITGHDLRTPRSVHGSFQRFRLLFQIVQAMRRREVACWIFADMGGSALTLLRYLMRLGQVTVPVIVVAHGLFEPLGWNTAPRPAELPGMRGPSLPNLRLVVLGGHVMEALRDFPLHHREDIRLLPHPVLEIGQSHTASPTAHHFVFPGVPDKGLASFASLAAEVNSGQQRACFTAAGFASGEEAANSLSHLTSVAQSPLSVREYFSRLTEATYGIWFTMHDPNPYQYRASGTIPDLLASGKPAIFKRNSMVDAYFANYGPIGHRCDTLPALALRVKEMSAESPASILPEHRAAVARAREALLPQSLAPMFREIVLGSKTTSHA
jgi:hypothetical protein